MMNSRVLVAVYASVLVFVSPSSNAATVTIDFTATVTFVNSTLSNSSSLLGASGVGSIQYNLTQDSTVFPTNRTIYGFDYPNATYSFALPSAGITFMAPDASNQDVTVQIGNDQNNVEAPANIIVDYMRFLSDWGGQPLEGLNTRMDLYFADSSATAFSDESLSNILNPVLYDISNFDIDILLPGSIVTTGLSFSIDSVSVTTVPVPPAFWLFNTGLLGLIRVARRKIVLSYPAS